MGFSMVGVGGSAAPSTPATPDRMRTDGQNIIFHSPLGGSAAGLLINGDPARSFTVVGAASWGTSNTYGLTGKGVRHMAQDGTGNGYATHYLYCDYPTLALPAAGDVHVSIGLKIVRAGTGSHVLCGRKAATGDSFKLTLNSSRQVSATFRSNTGTTATYTMTDAIQVGIPYLFTATYWAGGPSIALYLNGRWWGSATGPTGTGIDWTTGGANNGGRFYAYNDPGSPVNTTCFGGELGPMVIRSPGVPEAEHISDYNRLLGLL
jgi:hypothetical protein